MTVVEQFALGGLALNAAVIVGTQFAGYIKLRAKVDAIVVQTTKTNGAVGEIQSGGCTFRREHIAREIAEGAASAALQAHIDAVRAYEMGHEDATLARAAAKEKRDAAHSDADRAHADAQGAASELRKEQ